MIKILPFVLIPILLIGGLTYFRFVYLPSRNLESPKTESRQTTGPVEVPKSLPNATADDKIAVLEQSVATLTKELNNLKSGGQSSSSDTTKLSNAEAAIVELKARVSALEKSTPAPAVASSSKSTIYIPLGSGGGPWGGVDWNTLNDYQISLDPANFPGYTGMILEVNFRMVESAGTAYVRLYNNTDKTATSSELSTTSTTFGLSSSSSFTLPGGSKTYVLQLKSSQNKDVFVQMARIKVSF